MGGKRKKRRRRSRGEEGNGEGISVDSTQKKLLTTRPKSALSVPV
jgi:hypothetical protein